MERTMYGNSKTVSKPAPVSTYWSPSLNQNNGNQFMSTNDKTGSNKKKDFGLTKAK